MDFSTAIVKAQQSIEASRNYDNDGIAYALIALALAVKSMANELEGIKIAIEHKLF